MKIEDADDASTQHGHGRTKSVPRDLFAFPVTNLKMITAGILKEDGVVMRVFVGWSLHISRAGLNGDRSQPINLADTVSPKRDPALVGDMLRRLRHPNKLWHAIGSSRLILQPPLNLGIAREAERGQEHLIKRPRLGEAAHSEINVIEATSHQWNMDFRFKMPYEQERLARPSTFRLGRKVPSGSRQDRGTISPCEVSRVTPDRFRCPDLPL
jgi:hypothetical protein